MISSSYLKWVKMTLLGSFPPCLTNSAGILSCPVAIPLINLLTAISMSTSSVAQHTALRSERTPSTILHCNCMFHLAVQSISHTIQASFVLLSLYYCSFCLIFLLIILLSALFLSCNIIWYSSSNEIFLCDPLSNYFFSCLIHSFLYFVPYFTYIFHFF
jgi:hypothetical protein